MTTVRQPAFRKFNIDSTFAAAALEFKKSQFWCILSVFVAVRSNMRKLSAIVPFRAVGNLPHVVKISPAEHHLFVTNLESNSISVIATMTHPLGINFIY